MPLKLSDVKEPRFELELPDGTTKSYDPWELSEKISDGLPDTQTQAQTFDAIRVALGFPTQADADATEPNQYTPTRHHCMAIQAAILELIEGLEVSKKLLSPSRK